MNLTKLFNFKYFKENLKKSKGIVALSLIIVPIFTLLFTILVINDKNTIAIPSKGEISIINYLGMYVIPVLISFVLFGYVYKKKSVDFINSQPINRRTIFLTNTIGGILLLGFIQLLTSIVLLISSAVLPNVIIFPQMILDIFIMMWIAYSFVFVATNIAMSVSGTFCTQIVVTMLILFLVPFTIDSYTEFSSEINYEMINQENSYNQFVKTDTYYTMPYQPFHVLFTNQTSEFDWFSIQSVSRMIVLGFVYYFVGSYLFRKRKMENNEESFFNERTHIIVKALTIFPMIVFLNLIDAGTEFNIFAIAIIITYFFVYDFIVKRKIKLKSSLGYLVIILAVLQGICSGSQIIRDAMPINKLNVNNISAIKFGAYNYRSYSDYTFNEITRYGGYIENEEIINTIFNSVSKYNVYKYNVNETVEASEVYTETVEDKIVSNNEIDNNLVDCNIIAKTQTGKVYEITCTILREDLEKVMKLLSEDEKYLSNLRKAYTRGGITTINNFILLENEEKEEICKEIENAVNNMSLEELRNLNDTEKTGSINKYFYKDHKLRGVSIKDSITPKVLEIVSKKLNESVINKLRNDEIEYYDYSVYPKNITTNPASLNYRIYFNDEIADEIKRLILDNENEKFDVSKPYYIINIGGRHTLQFYTNKVDLIESFITRQNEYENSFNYDKEIFPTYETIQ